VTVSRLIIFTRYPTPGRVKTRLIPAVGAEGAARLHRQMTAHTVHEARRWLSVRPGAITICYDGSDRDGVQEDWLGKDLDYQLQSAGDLGIRMNAAIEFASNSGAERVVLVGTDCPGLTAAIITTAFDRLLTNDLVLGAAVDGGYYLIGMCRARPELFTEIEWSTDRVCSQTIEIAQTLNLSIGDVETLGDVDRPEDLHLLSKMYVNAKISIVIPTLNEAKSIARVLANINLPNVEPIVVDGGSSDNTVEIVRGLGIEVITSAPGRARQMNAGAKAATGEILLFLHADTLLPLGFDRLVREALQPSLTQETRSPVAGAFALKIDSDRPSLRSIEWLVNWRSRWRQMPYGDQAIFLTAATFWEIDGFPEQPIMEDFELIRRLQRQGKIEIVPIPAITSARRWLKLGIWKTTFINQSIVIAYLLGVSPARLAAWYRNK
jgi:uncharacterized protein